MNIFNTNLITRVIDLLNNDQMVYNNTKWYTFNLVLKTESTQCQLTIQRGQVSLKNIPEKLPEIIITGSNENWNKILNGLPGGLHRAFRHRLLEFSGDPIIMLSVWKTIYRLGVALAQAKEEN